MIAAKKKKQSVVKIVPVRLRLVAIVSKYWLNHLRGCAIYMYARDITHFSSSLTVFPRKKGFFFVGHRFSSADCGEAIA